MAAGSGRIGRWRLTSTSLCSFKNVFFVRSYRGRSPSISDVPPLPIAHFSSHVPPKHIVTAPFSTHRLKMSGIFFLQDAENDADDNGRSEDVIEVSSEEGDDGVETPKTLPSWWKAKTSTANWRINLSPICISTKTKKGSTK